MCLSRVCLAGLLVGLMASASLAARDHQPKDQASHVLTGWVRAVYSHESEFNRHYVVEIVIDKVERGGGLKSGEAVVVSCYQPKPRTGKETEEKLRARSFNVDGGHSQVPGEGDTVRAFANYFNGMYDANFPDWLDVIKGAEAQPDTKPGVTPAINSDSSSTVGDRPIWPWATGALLVGLVGGFAAAHICRAASCKRVT